MPDDRPMTPKETPFGPPDPPILVHCVHCGEEYDSYLIQWRFQPLGDGPPEGIWCCPTPGCDGVGFCFDIWPVDPDWTDPEGNKVCFETDDEEFDDEDDIAGSGNAPPGPPPSDPRRNGKHPPPEELSDGDIPF